MIREEFLRGLKDALAGQIPPAAVQQNLQYYDDYIRTEISKGRTEQDVMEELGEPRLIARTIIDTTPGAGEDVYDEYRSENTYDSGSSGSYREEGQGGFAGSYQSQGNIHYYDLSKWYWKVLGIVIVIAVVTLVIAVVSGVLTLIIPVLPVLIAVWLVMRIVGGPKR